MSYVDDDESLDTDEIRMDNHRYVQCLAAAAVWTQLLFRSLNVPVGVMRDSLLSPMTHSCPVLFAGHVCFAVLVDVRRNLSG